MTRVNPTTLARLQGQIDRIESGVDGSAAEQMALGHRGVDLALQGGLRRGALHEVYEAQGPQSAAATGFVLGIARRLTEQRGFVLWVRQDFAARETGDVCMSGFAEMGFDPRRIVVVRAQNAEMALRVTADGLACNALGAVVSEIWGDARALDLAATRKLTLAAGQSGVTALMLRMNAPPQSSTAETRWIVRAARSPPRPDWMALDTPWGAPVFDAELIRNRHGPLGRWIMEWTSDESRFSEQTTHSQPDAAAPADRPYPPAAQGRGREDARHDGHRRAS